MEWWRSVAPPTEVEEFDRQCDGSSAVSACYLPFHWQDYLLQLIESGTPEEEAIRKTVHYYHKGELMGRQGLGKSITESTEIVCQSWLGR